MPVIDPGYRLPSGDLTNDELNCMILFYPDRDEYRRALWGALDYFGTWRAWERDTAKRGKDAAAIWKTANECTWECFDMACLDTLLEEVQAIRALVQGFDPCCGEHTTILPGPGITTDIEPGVGDPPDYYGETAITDWDDWAEHVCYNAHRWVDQLVATAESYNQAAQNGILTLGLIAAGLALMSFTGIGIPVAISIAVAVLSATAAGGALIFSTTAQDLEDAREDIVCALLLGNDVSAVIEAALGSASLDWTSTFYANDYESATAIIYEGGANGEYLPTETDDSCSCVEPTLFEYGFDSDVESWAVTGLAATWVSPGYYQIQNDSTGAWRSAGGGTGDELLTQHSLSGSLITIEKIQVRFQFYTPGTSLAWQFRLSVVEKDTATAYYTDTYTQAAEGDNTWVEKEFTFSTPVVLRETSDAIYMHAYRPGAASGGQRIQVDWIKYYGYTT